MCMILRFWGLSGDSARLLVQALVISGVDDSNSLLAGLQNDIRILTPPSLPSLWRFERFFCSVWTLWSRLSASSGVTFPSLSKTAHSLKKPSLREALYDSASLSPKAHICLLQYLSASFTKKNPPVLLSVVSSPAGSSPGHQNICGTSSQSAVVVNFPCLAIIDF